MMFSKSRRYSLMAWSNYKDMEVHSKFLIMLQEEVKHLFLYHRVSHP